MLVLSCLYYTILVHASTILPILSCLYTSSTILPILKINNYYYSTACTNGAVRLVGGASSNEGKLEYCHYGAWSSVCYNFDDEEATVACKQLGFSGSPSKDIPV